jgi:hypothetical protein
MQTQTYKFEVIVTQYPNGDFEVEADLPPKMKCTLVTVALQRLELEFFERVVTFIGEKGTFKNDSDGTIAGAIRVEDLDN